jgi:hypothetical protein
MPKKNAKKNAKKYVIKYAEYVIKYAKYVISIENDMYCQKYAKYAIKYEEYAKYVILKKICRICTPHFADANLRLVTGVGLVAAIGNRPGGPARGSSLRADRTSIGWPPRPAGHWPGSPAGQPLNFKFK